MGEAPAAEERVVVEDFSLLQDGAALSFRERIGDDALVRWSRTTAT